MSPTVFDEYQTDTQRKKNRMRQADKPSEPECRELSGNTCFHTSVYVYMIDQFVSELDRRYQVIYLLETLGFRGAVPMYLAKAAH